jgi:hypothetical protein
VLTEVRRQLAEPARGNVERQDRAALAAFYAARNEPLLWVTSDGFTTKARHAMAEIRKADDWGLSASAFELPQLAQGTAAPDALAGAEIKLGLAALKYARHARGGRLDPAQISKDLDQKPSLRDPKVVLQALAATETPGNYLRDLNPSMSSSSGCARLAEGPQRALHPEPVKDGNQRAATRRRAEPQARQRASAGRNPAPAAQPAAASWRGERLRPAGAGRGARVPAAKQHPGHRHPDATHALRAQWRRETGQARTPCPARRRSDIVNMERGDGCRSTWVRCTSKTTCRSS